MILLLKKVLLASCRRSFARSSHSSQSTKSRPNESNGFVTVASSAARTARFLSTQRSTPRQLETPAETLPQAANGLHASGLVALKSCRLAVKVVPRVGTWTTTDVQVPNMPKSQTYAPVRMSEHGLGNRVPGKIAVCNRSAVPEPLPPETSGMFPRTSAGDRIQGPERLTGSSGASPNRRDFLEKLVRETIY